MATPYLVITDGITTITFLNSTTLTNYFIESGSWTPNIAGKRRSPFGGVSPYEDVEEEINVRVRGSSASDCYSKVAALSGLLNQAEGWNEEENNSPVLIKFAPNGSTVASDTAPLQAVILGRAEGDETNAVTLVPEWDQAAYAFVLPVRVRFMRRGVWVLGGTLTPIVSTAVTSSARTSVNFGSTAQVRSPVSVSIGTFARDTTLTSFPSSYFIAASVSHTGAVFPISIIEAETMTATGFTSVADSANSASGGNVLRYTPAGTAYATTNTENIFVAEYQYLAFFATLRNNSASATFQVKVQRLNSFPTETVLETSPVLIDNSSTQPRVVLLGLATQNLVGSTATPRSYRIAVAASTTSGSPTLDIDVITVVGWNRPDDVSIIAIHGFAFDAVNTSIVIDDATTEHITPKVYTTDASGSFIFPGYAGNPYITHRQGVMHFALLATQSQYWRIVNTSGAKTFTYTATRQVGYLTPQ